MPILQYKALLTKPTSSAPWLMKLGNRLYKEGTREDCFTCKSQERIWGESRIMDVYKQSPLKPATT